MARTIQMQTIEECCQKIMDALKTGKFTFFEIVFMLKFAEEWLNISKRLLPDQEPDANLIQDQIFTPMNALQIVHNLALSNYERGKFNVAITKECILITLSKPALTSIDFGNFPTVINKLPIVIVAE